MKLNLQRISGNYGWCEIRDCIEGLQSIKRGGITLIATDPIYNVKHGNTKKTYKKKALTWKRKDPELYEDERTPEEYQNWCAEWLDECRRVAEITAIYCGLGNLTMWVRDIARPKGYAFHYKSNAKHSTAVGHLGRVTPIVIYASKIPRKNKLNEDIIVTRGRCSICEEINMAGFEYYSKWGYLLKPKDRKKYNHPCPLRHKFWHHFIQQINPSSVADPFLGSGTTAQVCETLGIRWIGFDNNPAYIPDIERRIAKGILSARWFQVSQQQQLEAFFK